MSIELLMVKYLAASTNILKENHSIKDDIIHRELVEMPLKGKSQGAPVADSVCFALSTSGAMSQERMLHFKRSTKGHFN